MASFIWASYLTHFFWPFFSQEITVKMEDLYIVNSLAFSMSCGATCLCCNSSGSMFQTSSGWHLQEMFSPRSHEEGKWVGRVWGFLWLFLKSGVFLEREIKVCFHHRKSNFTDSDLVTKKVWAPFISFYCQGVNVCFHPAHIYSTLYTIPGQAQTLTVDRKIT